LIAAAPPVAVPGKVADHGDQFIVGFIVGLEAGDSDDLTPPENP